MDFYAILGIPRDADQETIRGAYRMLARRYHPDKGAGSSTEKFRQAAEAYETLIDPGRRHGYDLSLRVRRPSVLRAEPMTASPEPLRQESPNVFGRFERAPFKISIRPEDDIDRLFHDNFDKWIRSFDDVSFFGTLWR